MTTNERKYLEFNRFPAKGINELYNIARIRIIDELEEKLSNGQTDSTIYDPIYDFYIELLTYDYSSLVIGIATEAYEKITEYEHNHPGHLIDKEKLYFLIALISTSTGNTITATAYWELTLKEYNRVNGNVNNIGLIIADMPTRFTTLMSPVSLRHDNNPLILSLSHYSFIDNFTDGINRLSDLSLLSFLACGIRNVHVNTFFDKYQLRIDVVKMYGQELINNLCVLNETELKKNTNIQRLITNPKKRMIGPMIQRISQFNSGVHSILGNPFTNQWIRKSGLYIDSRYDFSTEANFNSNYPNFISKIESGTLSDDELKAYILYGFHSLRNNVLHDLRPTLIYFTDIDLFLKTIGLLFAGLSVIRSL